MQRTLLRVRRLCLALLMGIAFVLLTLYCMGQSSVLTEAAYYYPPSSYGTLYMYVGNSDGLWSESYRGDMRAVLQQARALSLTTVVQGFPNDLAGGREHRWLIFLDEAEAAGIDVIAHLILGGAEQDACWYNSGAAEFNCDALKHFLDEVADHPALAGYFVLHEGLQRYDSDQFQAVYAEMKAYAPNLLLANYMSDIYWFEQRPEQFPNRDFRDGMCDFCMLWYFPFRTVDNEPVFESNQVEALIENNLPLMRARDPDARFWFLAQTFAYEAHPRDLRFPTPEEMTELYQLVMQYPIDGFFWYPWQHGTYDASLGDPGKEDQRNELGDIADSFLREADLSIQQNLLADVTELSPNDVLTYTLTFVNNGPEEASGVVIEDILPDVFIEPAIVGSSGASIAQISGTIFSWDVETLGVDQSGMVTLTARISPALTTRVSITTVAVISATTIDIDSTNNRSSLNAVVCREADLSIQQALLTDVTELSPDDFLTYTLTFMNNGPDKASRVVVEYILPDELQQPAVIASSGSSIEQTPGTTFSWGVGTVRVQQGGTITLTARISPALETPFSIATIATISATTIDDQLTNNQSIVDFRTGYYRLFLSFIKR